MNAVDQLLQAAVEAGDAAGISAVIVDDSGIRYQGAAGYQDRNSNTAMTPSSIVRIASMTKAITSTAAMQQVERGALHLHEPIGNVLAALKNAPVLEGFDAHDRPVLRPMKGDISLRHLLTHTSGLAYTTWNESLLKLIRQDPAKCFLDGPSARVSMPLVADPGDHWEYSTSTDWAGLAVEKSAAQRLGDYMQGNIFSPLGMHDTRFHVADKSRSSSVQRRETDGSLSVIDESTFPTPSYDSGGGGLFSTAVDYGKFLHALLGSAEVSIVKPATLALMKENHIGDLVAGTLPCFEADRSHPFAFYSGLEPRWGLFGLINTHDVPGGRAAGSVSWGGLFNSYFWVDSRHRIAGAIFTQTLPFLDPRTVAVYEKFEQLAYA